MNIAEPATLITDYLLAAFTGYLSWRLFRAADQNGLTTMWWWAMAFASTAVAGVAGGSVHGFRRMLHPSFTAALWLVTLESLVVAAFAVIRGTLVGSPLRPETVRAASLVAGGAYLAYGVWIANHPRFVFAIGAYGVALSVLVAFKLGAWQSERRAARWMMAGVIVSVLAAVVQQSGWSLHRHFNHNDLYHVVQAIGVWLLYRGAMLGGRRSAVGGRQSASGIGS